MDKGISGADVIKESLRRDCIWKIYGQENGIGTEWWDYVNEFMLKCDKEENFTNDSCANDCFTHSGVDQAKVEECMKSSGGLTGNTTNTILELELYAKYTTGVNFYPVAYVNSIAVLESLDFATVFNTICASFVQGFKPGVCQKCAMSTDEFNCVVQFGSKSGSKTGFTKDEYTAADSSTETGKHGRSKSDKGNGKHGKHKSDKGNQG